ncbi:low-density lipoprotein receptor-related protein 4-like [Strongylocentrotus purpuratus]|uniref:EGF-like domain-containing protein n=1 Tax=Strongylocentrotus purpuratus TaxID=7668 RepID=A0A7M7PI37_STRPU|nr:low-density lipoprotein receptor-related protein 4-like [Strongylocentrotus purpuratus]
MESSSVGNALYFGLLVLLFQLNAVISTDKLFVADGALGQIFLAETDGDSFLASPLTPLNLTINEAPIGLDYDYRSDMIYWSDQDTHTIHRSTLNGSFQEVIASGTIVPHGIVLDLEEDKVFWLSAGSGNLYRANLDGSNLEILNPVFMVPRGITISYNRRKLYITTRLSSPAIRSVNTDGTNDVVLIDTDIASPSGIAFNFQEQRLYWADDSLDKIESMDPDNSTDRIILLSVTAGSTLNLFPFGLALHYDDVYFSDINSGLVIFVDSSSGEVKTLPSLFSLPVEVHIYIDVCANRCLNNGSCVRSLTSVKCSCPFGFLGSRCEIDACTNRCVNGGTCAPSERGSICICPEGFSGSKCNSDLTIHTQSKFLAYIESQTGITLEEGYNSAFIGRSGFSTTGHLTSICLHPNT